MNKNDEIILDITDFTDTGNGLGRYENTVVFVPNTAVGDRVKAIIIKVNKNYCIGKLTEIINPSVDRITSDCPCFLKCGGCTYRHISYEKERSLKQKRVEDCIKRIGKVDMSPMPIVSNNKTDRYRNKAQFPVGEDGAVGFYAPRSHRIIPVNDCLLQPECFTRGTEALKNYMAETGVSVYNEISGKGLIRHLYMRSNSDLSQIMAVLIINGDGLPKKEIFIKKMQQAFGKNLKSLQLNINKKKSNVILGEKNILLYGDDYITDTLCGIKIRLSPNSFYQVNKPMAELLYKKVEEYANPKGKIIVDLYCGTGTIGLCMANKAKSVIGVEIVEDAVNDAVINAHNNGISNARFICADALKAANDLKNEKLKPDVVIIDPPRKGCEKDLIRIITENFSPDRVVYVSCDPSTLARDVNIFEQFGYSLVEYTPFDLFPRTPHVESVCLISKVK